LRFYVLLILLTLNLKPQTLNLHTMAKKVVATLKTGKGKDFSRVIKMIKNPETGSYSFKEEVVHNDHIKDFLKQK
jgi:hypothetical protein